MQSIESQKTPWFSVNTDPADLAVGAASASFGWYLADSIHGQGFAYIPLSLFKLTLAVVGFWAGQKLFLKYAHGTFDPVRDKQLLGANPYGTEKLIGAGEEMQ